MSDTYQKVTDEIISQLEKGVVPWRKPWTEASLPPRNLATKKPYRGINRIILQYCRPYTSPYWLTYNQAHKLGGYVKRGEKSTTVVFWTQVKKSEYRKDDNGKIIEQDFSYPVMREYRVFNAEQCEGLKLPENPEQDPIEAKNDALDDSQMVLDAFLMREKIKMNHRGNGRAFYRPTTDSIHLPAKKSFESLEKYFSVAFHEASHATGHKSRLDRFTDKNFKFASDAYSEEELIAELSAAFVCSECGIIGETHEMSAGYIKHWLDNLRKDKKLIMVLSSRAEKAASWVLDGKGKN